MSVGQQLLAPEAGWVRFDGSDPRVVFIAPSSAAVNQWKSDANAQYYNGEDRYSAVIGARISFLFTGTRIRLLDVGDQYRAYDVSVSIDGVSQTVSLANLGPPQTVFFEKTGLPNTKHTVLITLNVANYMGFDCVDIDSGCEIFHPALANMRTAFADVSVIGDYLKARYAALSGAFGAIFEVGNCTKPAILPSGTATPDGSFLLIFCGYDSEGRKLFIADRNIQHSISYSTLDAAGITTGISILDSPGVKCTLQLPTGGSSSTDKDNEWDNIVAGSSLGGLITPGDTNVWNWRGSLAATWTVNTTTNTNKVTRGEYSYSGTVYGTNDVSFYTTQNPSTASNVAGFRPVLLVESTISVNNLMTTPSLVHNSNIALTCTCTAETQVKYQVSVNGVVVIPYGILASSPISVNLTLDNSLFIVGTNTVQVTAMNAMSEAVSASTTVTKTNIAPTISAISNTITSLVVRILDADADSVSYKIERLDSDGVVLSTIIGERIAELDTDIFIDLSSIDFYVGDRIKITTTDEIGAVTAQIVDPVIPDAVITNPAVVSNIHIGDSELTATLTTDKGEMLYRVLKDGVEIYPWEQVTSPVNIDKALANNLFTVATVSTITLEVKNTAGKTASWQGFVTKNNTRPSVTASTSHMTLTANITDPESDTTRYKLKVNGVQVYPESDFTDFLPTPIDISYRFNASDVIIDEQNTLLIEFEDSLGSAGSWAMPFTPTYQNIMLLNNGLYMSDDMRNVLNRPDLGIVKAGGMSSVLELMAKNMTGKTLAGVRIWTDTVNEGQTYQFSRTATPFVAENDLLIEEELVDGASATFYMRVVLAQTVTAPSSVVKVRVEEVIGA